MSESLYRKYRPQVFSDVVGQDHIIKTLQNSISSNKVSHAYLFCGPRGTGKTTTARILAKALLCEHGPTVEPDGTCEDCQMIARSVHPDVSELDAASRTGVENVRDEIISRVGYAPVRGNYKVYVIDEVHMLSNAAFNALLKTLEEPPSHIVFVLCTTDPQKVPETIRSRCQRFDFRPINTEELTGRLGAVCEMENVPFEGEALELIARRSNGGLRDALTALEQTIAFGSNKVSLAVAQDMFGKTDVNDLNELVSALAEKNINKCLEFVGAKVNDGVDFVQFVDDFAQRMRDVYVMKLSNCDVSVSATDADLEQIKQKAALFDEARLKYTLSIIRDLVSDLKTASNQRLVFELGIFKMLDEHCAMTFEAIDARLCALENGVQAAPKGPPTLKNPQGLEVRETAGISDQGLGISEAQVQESAPVSSAVANKGGGPSKQETQVQTPAATPQRTVPSAEKIDFRSIWKTTLDDLKKTNPAIFTLLDAAHGKFNQAQKIVTFNLDEDRKFAYTNLSKPSSKTVIIEALERAGLVGATIKVEMIENSGEDPLKPKTYNLKPNKGDGPSTQETPAPAPAPSRGDGPYGAEGTVLKITGDDLCGTEAANGDDPLKPKTYNLKPSIADASSGVPAEPKPETDDSGKNEIGEFNEILSSTFGEGTTFKEVK